MSKISRRKYVGILGGAAVAAAAGYGIYEYTRPRREKKLTILWSKYCIDTGYDKWINDKFQETHPGWTVEMFTLPYEELMDKVLVAGAAGKAAADIFYLDCVWPATMGEAGYAMDVTDRIKSEYKANIFEAMWDTCMYKEKYWGLPQRCDAGKFTYFDSKKVEEAGFDPETFPQSYEDVKAVGEAVTVPGEYWGMAWNWAKCICAWIDFENKLKDLGQNEFSGENSGWDDPMFNSDKGVEALEWLVDAWPWSDPASSEFRCWEHPAELMAGKVAMVLTWTGWEKDMRDPDKSVIYETARLGLHPGLSCVGNEALAISAFTENPEEAWDLLELLCTDEEYQKQYMLHTGRLPVMKELFEDPDLMALAPDLLGREGLVFRQLENNAWARPTLTQFGAVTEIMSTEVQNALLKMKTPEQALNDAYSKVVALEKPY